MPIRTRIRVQRGSVTATSERSVGEDRIISGDVQKEEDDSLDTTLRPRRLEEFIGQEKLKDNLAIAVQAARKRDEPLDHLLLYGPPGLGKTTLSHIIASEMGVSVRVTSGPAIERAGDLAAILTSLQEFDVLFIDEVHRLPRAAEEVLYPAMEDFALDIVLGRGPGARSVRLSVPRFTLVGATTRYAMLSAPLRDRFGAVYRLDFYDRDAITAIVLRNAGILGVPIDGDGALEIAQRARGTPRVANRLLRRVRDYAQVRAQGRIDAAVARDALERLEVDALGLDEVDKKVLLTIIEKYDGGPVGIETIAASISEEADTIMDVYEPYLMQVGFLQRTPRGRVVTRHAYAHLGLEVPANADAAQQSLFE
ncbi:MAG TPA: Holliday junction branch migration DNA helicase RuvB [Dehalococcoidia bacterium]|nr:Holliday junction branch migration DNA helicase RuvB [Dehalococcoidia bacterium]